MPLIATYLALVLCLALFLAPFAIGALQARGRSRPMLDKVAELGVVLQLAAFMGAYLVLRPGHGTDRKAIEATMKTGSPVFIELYSNS